MFEKATRLKYRFPYKGSCSVEDLWELSVEELDNIFKSLNSNLKTTKEESLLSGKSREANITEAKIEIVRHIVGIKLQEAENRKLAKDKKEKQDKIKEILAEKQDAALRDKSVEELLKMMEE